MPFGPANFQDLQAFPQRAIYPAFRVVPIDVTIAGGMTAFLGGNANGDWSGSSYSKLSWVLDCRSGTPPADPLSVVILISPDNGTTTYPYDVIPLHVGGHNFLHDYFLPGWIFRLQAVNSSATDTNSLVGLIRVQAVT